MAEVSLERVTVLLAVEDVDTVLVLLLIGVCDEDMDLRERLMEGDFDADGIAVAADRDMVIDEERDFDVVGSAVSDLDGVRL